MDWGDILREFRGNFKFLVLWLVYYAYRNQYCIVYTVHHTCTLQCTSTYSFLYDPVLWILFMYSSLLLHLQLFFQLAFIKDTTIWCLFIVYSTLLYCVYNIRYTLYIHFNLPFSFIQHAYEFIQTSNIFIYNFPLL